MNTGKNTRFSCQRNVNYHNKEISSSRSHSLEKSKTDDIKYEQRCEAIRTGESVKWLNSFRKQFGNHLLLGIYAKEIATYVHKNT